MNINLLYSFMALRKYKNVSKACKFLNISQQGLSKQIKSLEEEIGINLFQRTPSGVVLTSCGEKMTPFFQQIIENYERMLNVANDCKNEVVNKIKVGIAQGVTSAIGLDFIVEFNKDHPNIVIETIELFDDECEQTLLNGELDFAFLVSPFDKNAVDHKIVYTDYAYALINNSHPYATTRESIDMTDLDRQNIMILNKQYVLRRVFDKKCQDLNVEPNILFSTNSVASYINLPDSVVAIGIILGFFQQYVESDNVTIMPLKGAPIYNVHFCKIKRRELSKHCNLFYQFIKTYF